MPFQRARSGSAASAAIARPTNRGVSEMAKCGTFASASRQFSSVTPKMSSITSERSQPGVTATAVRLVLAQLVRPAAGEPDRRDLGQVVVDVEPVVLGVVLRGAVGDLDDQRRLALRMSSGNACFDVMRWVSIAQPQQPEPVVERVLPHRRVPLGEEVAAEDVVDQHVEAALLGVDPRDQRRRPVSGTRWSVGTAIPVPPAAVTSSAVSSIVSGRL